jgi:hypothetical protein
MTDFGDSMQHVDFQPSAIVHYARCESCMYGSHFETVTWHSWAGPDDMREDDAEYNARVKTQKCHCDCAGPLDHGHASMDAQTGEKP